MGQFLSSQHSQPEHSDHQGQQTTFQRFSDSLRRSLRWKRAAPPAERGGTRPVELQSEAQKTPTRTPLPASFRQDSTPQSPDHAPSNNVHAVDPQQQSPASAESAVHSPVKSPSKLREDKPTTIKPVEVLPVKSQFKASTPESTPVELSHASPVETPANASTNESKPVQHLVTSPVKSQPKSPQTESTPSGTTSGPNSPTSPVQPTISEGVKSTIENSLASIQASHGRARLMMSNIANSQGEKTSDSKPSVENPPRQNEARQLVEDIISASNQSEKKHPADDQGAVSTAAPGSKLATDHPSKETERHKTSALIDVLKMEEDGSDGSDDSSAAHSHESTSKSSDVELTDKALHQEPENTESREVLMSALVKSIKHKNTESHTEHQLAESRTTAAEDNDDKVTQEKITVVSEKSDKVQPTQKELESVLAKAIISKEHEMHERKELVATLTNAIAKEGQKLHSERIHNTVDSGFHPENEDRKSEHLEEATVPAPTFA
ncbi:hypothetical protein AAHC03_020954 [Spirometra sp. Aus1]